MNDIIYFRYFLLLNAAPKEIHLLELISKIADEKNNFYFSIKFVQTAVAFFILQPLY